MSKSVQYRVRPVTRYIITRFESEEDVAGAGACGSSTRGEYDNADTAYDVAYALCKLEHEQLGYPAFDERVQYPLHPDAESASISAGSGV